MPLLSYQFALFVLMVWSLYWFALKDRSTLQNFLLIAASYFFYGMWDWRFLFLIGLNSTVDFFIGSKLGRTSDPRRRKLLLAASLTVNLGLLGFFKYFNFFIDSFIRVFNLVGISLQPMSLRIIFPVAISYYTLQTLGYTLDIYRGKTKPTGDWPAFFAYISFFPKLLSGPIERSNTLLPQFQRPRIFDDRVATDGMRQILWGLFKKVVVADNCALAVNGFFGNPAAFPGSTLFIGIVLFAVQIYADFSGYSDIAIGIGRLFGFSMGLNFAYPYFSKSITEFWRRWHIALSSWLRDYIFLPLAYALSRKMKKELYIGIRADRLINAIAVLVTFLLCGFWHGANFTFLVWGLLFGIYLAVEILFPKKRRVGVPITGRRLWPPWRDIFHMGRTFFLVLFAWAFFRADSVPQAVQYISGIFSQSFFAMPKGLPTIVMPFLLVLFLVEWLQRGRPHALDLDSLGMPKIMRFSVYYLLCLIIFAFGSFQTNFEFFYLKY
jgi:D-alanyl-lipoteichoic acid acyltransferase DltB (MBOAT superfamily)